MALSHLENERYLSNIIRNISALSNAILHLEVLHLKMTSNTEVRNECELQNLFLLQEKLVEYEDENIIATYTNEQVLEKYRRWSANSYSLEGIILKKHNAFILACRTTELDMCPSRPMLKILCICPDCSHTRDMRRKEWESILVLHEHLNIIFHVCVLLEGYKEKIENCEHGEFKV